jgi:hypothetical protein
MLGGLCLVASGYLHAQLYVDGYRVIPKIGPMFLLQASAALAVGILLLLTASPPLRVIGVGLAAGALGGFVLSRTVGVFGFTERGWEPAPQALLSVLAEVAAIGLLAAPGLVWTARRLFVMRTGQ